MTQYESLPGFMFFKGRHFSCPCGNKNFRVEIGPDPRNFWCDCGAVYTEYLVDAMGMEREEVLDSVQ